MAIQFQCPYCSATIRVPDSASGKAGQCPKCQARLKIPEVAPPPPGSEIPPTPSLPQTGPLLGDKSTVFLLPPVEVSPPVPGGLIIGPPPEPIAPPPPAAINPQQAREEYEQGQTWLTKPYVPGAGWPAADRAVQHFRQAAAFDPRNSDYATRAGIACATSIERFLESWGKGPLISIAACHLNSPLGKQIDKTEQLFRPSGLSPDNLQLLQQRANEGLEWYAKALAIDATDSIARCYRAELLRNLGAFGAALDDAKGVLGSSLVPTKTRDAAQQVADFILGEDSPLRKYLTRSEAQNLPAPDWLRLSKSRAAAASALATQDEIPLFTPRGSLDPTQAEVPLFAGPVGGASAASSVATRLKKQRKSGGWGGVVIPVVLGLVLVAVGLGYLYFNRVTLTGPLTATDLGGATLRKLIPRHEFGLPDERIEALLAFYREEPENIRTQLRALLLRGTPEGLEVSVRPGEKGRLVRVDLKTHAGLTQAIRDHAAELQSPLQPLREETLKKFASDFEKAQSAGMKLGNMQDYLNTLGGDLLVGSLGYRVVGVTADQEFPCIFEDDAGVYFLIPSGVTAFDVIERKFEGQEPLFGEEMRFNVTVAPPAAPAPAVPAPVPTAPEPAATEPTAEPGADGQADATLPENFFGTEK